VVFYSDFEIISYSFFFVKKQKKSCRVTMNQKIKQVSTS
jgi:hypothetical protein